MPPEVLFIHISKMSKRRFPFLRSDEGTKLLLLLFNFRKIRVEPLIPPLMPLPPYWPSLCPPFSKAKVERYTYDIGIPKKMQLLFYASILQKAIRFKIVAPLVAQDVTEAL